MARECHPADAATPAERSIRPGLLLTGGRTMAFAVTFLAPLVLVRVFDQAAFGTYKQLLLLAGTVAAVAQLGMADSLLYFLPSAEHRGGRYALNGLVVLAGSGAVCLSLLALGGPLLARWLGNPALSGLSGLLGLFVLLLLPSTMLEIVLIARRRYGGAGLAYGLSDLVRAAALVGPALITRSLEGLLLGAVAFGAIRLTVTLLYLRREFGAGLRPDGAALRGQLAYGLPLQLGVALWILVQNLHYYLVAAHVDAAAFAVYAVGCLQVPIIDILSTPARNLLTARMREALAADRRNAALALWHDTTRRLALVFFPLAGLLLATAHEVIPLLFTERYAASIPILMIWAMLAPIYAVQTDGVLAVYADTRAIAALHALQLLAMTALVLVLMRPLGLVGAVSGTVLAIWGGTTAALLHARRLMGARARDLLPWRSLATTGAAAAAAALVAFGVKGHLAAGPLPLIAVTSAVYAAAYLAILGLSGLRLGRRRALGEQAGF